MLFIGSLSLAVGFLEFFIQRNEIIQLEKEKGQLLKEITLLKMRLKICQSPRVEKKSLKPKINHHKESIPISSKTCQQCFENYQLKVEVKDQNERWIFKDDDIFDQRPGEMTLTERFWEELGESSLDKNFSQKEKIIKPKRLKNRISLSLAPSYGWIEYGYSPIGFRTKQTELNFSIYSAISFNYSFLPSSANAGLGLELRF